MIREKNRKNVIAFIALVLMMCCICIPVPSVEASEGETSLSDKPWSSSMTKILDSRNGEEYNAAGMCTGYVAWAIRNTELYDVDSWPKNGLVADFEARLKDKGVSRVSRSDAKAGDIVIFGDSHIAILGEDGMLHHNTNDGVRSHNETIEQWIEWGGNKTGEVKIYRGFAQKVKISIVKKSSDESQTEDNGCYSLQGAVYGLFSKGSSDPVVKLTTDSEGKASATVPAGSYILKEITAPEGFIKDESEYTVGSNGDVSKTVYDRPQSQAVEIIAYKTDGEIHTGWNEKNVSQGDALLEGAQFTVKYYKGLYTEEELGSVKPARTWIIETDEKGKALLTDKYLVSGDKLYKNSDGKPVIPLGTVSVQETKAPEGYLVNDEVYVQQIKGNEENKAIKTFSAPTVPQQIIRGGVQIQKWDSELDKSEALGGADYSEAVTGAGLKDIQFTISNCSDHPVMVNGKMYEKGEDIITLSTAWNEEMQAYTVETEDDYLPYGSYEIKEVKSNDSYILTDGKARAFEIRNNKGIVTADENDNMLIFKNEVVRGDLSFVKVSESSMQRLAEVPFLITNLTTGEAHVIVTDSNGYASTESSWNKHTVKTNENDYIIDENDSVKEKTLDPSAGIWFGLGEFGSMSEADNERGALPYGRYVIDELPCGANEGKHLIKGVEIFVYKNDVNIDMGTMINENIDEPENPDEPQEPDDPAVPQHPDKPEKSEKSDDSAETGDHIPHYIIIAATVMMAAAAAIWLAIKGKKNVI